MLQEDTFEDEVLIDDGYDSEEPLVGEEEEEEEGEGLDSSDGEGEEDSSAAEDEGEEEEGSEQAAGGSQAQEAGSDEGEWGTLAGRLVWLAAFGPASIVQVGRAAWHCFMANPQFVFLIRCHLLAGVCRGSSSSRREPSAGSGCLPGAAGSQRQGGQR